MNNKIGELIAKYRRDNKLTQRELAAKLGVSNTAVSKWECGNNLPDITMLKPLSEILNVDVLTLIGMEEEAIIENNSKSGKNYKKIILVSLLIFIILILLFSFIYSLTINSTKECIVEENNKNEFYRIYSDEEMLFNGYVFKSGNKLITFINQLVINDVTFGTEKELKANKFNIKILNDNSIIYDYSYVDDKNMKKTLNCLISESNILFYESYFEYIDMANIEDLTLLINYYDKDIMVGEFIIPLKMKNNN